MLKVRTRFAPSPTGSLHVGGLRTCVYAYALAKHSNGDFVLRIEDTDQKREIKGAREKMESIIKTFGIKWDEYYVQSERAKTGIYKVAAKRLIDEGHAFYCQCKAKNAKKEGFSIDLRDPCRDKNYESGAIKLRVPDNDILSYHDFVIDKDISWNSSTIADTTLLKSDGFPTYHLAVVVDDTDMNITHALRGHDWLPSTPIHILVYKYLGFKMPNLGHLTDILDPSGGKLSKRKASVSCEALISQGYLPEAILNFVVLLGWAPKNDKEMFSLDEFVSAFDKNGLQKSNPVYNVDKLDWFNGYYIREMTDAKLSELIFNFYKKKYPKDLVERTTPLIKERIKKLSDYETIADFFYNEPKVDKKLFGDEFINHLSSAIKALESVKEWNLEEIGKALVGAVEEGDYKTGKFFMDLRIAVTGSKITPPLNDSMEILGKEKTLSRLKKASK